MLAAIDAGGPRWPSAIQGAVVRRGPLLVHTLRRDAALDLAWCLDGRTEGGEECLEVKRISCLGPHRMSRPSLRKGTVVAAEEGAFERWHLQVGDRLEIRPT